MAAAPPTVHIPNPLPPLEHFAENIPHIGPAGPGGGVQLDPTKGDPLKAAKGVANTVEGLISILTAPNLWVRIAEFTVGGVLIVVGVSGMLKAGEKTRSGLRTTERAARVGYSVTPAGSTINRASRATARTARRARA